MQTGAVPWQRTSTVEHVPADPIGEAVAQSLVEILEGASVEIGYSPDDGPAPALNGDAAISETGEGPPGWRMTVSVRLVDRVELAVTPVGTPLLAMLEALPGAGLRAASRLRSAHASTTAPLTPVMGRALRDILVIELLGHLHAVRSNLPAMTELIEDTIEFLVELSGTRVESQDLTHGVVITDAFTDEPRLRFAYPADLQSAKRGPLLFDGVRSVLLVDRGGHARTELQRHRMQRLSPGPKPRAVAMDLADSGSLVAAATRLLGGVGFFLRNDRTIWVFVDGRPLVIRRAGHWTAFPLELAAFIGDLVGGGDAPELIVQTALIISAERRGAILAIVDDASVLSGIVSPKDRFDLRNEFDPLAMRVETRLHHLIDASELDAQTLARLAILDGATVLDRDANLLAYGAIVATSDSQYEGARTAAAKTLSETSEVVLKVSVDGDITVFQAGRAIVRLLGQQSDAD